MSESPADVLGLFETSQSILHFDDGSSQAASELALEARCLAHLLDDDGLQPGDRVALRLPNGPSYLRLLLACAAGGFVAVSVNTRYTDDEAADLIARSGAHVVDADRSISHVTPVERVARRTDRFVVFTTSGTTSKPKMVLHRQHSIADHAVDAGSAFGYRSDDCVLAVMPLCGTFGLASCLAGIAMDARIIVTDFDLDRTAALIAAHRVTCVNGSDDMFHRLLEFGADLSSIRLGGYARFNTSLDGIVERAETAGATLTGLYGMSEVQALFSLRDPLGSAADRSRPGGTLSSTHADFRVVDGELQLRGPSLFEGYLAEGGDDVDVALTGEHRDDGWFKTGDLAEAEADRTFEFLTRLGDVLRLGGFLVSPAEIESVLVEVDGIEEAQVVAIDRPGGARPVAFVIRHLPTAAEGTPAGPVEPFDEAAAIAHCRGRLARYKIPVRVIVLDEFPTTPSANGTKIQKVKLRDLGARSLASGTAAQS